MYTVAHFSTAAAPCATLGTIAFDDQSFIADCRYSLNNFGSQSVRAQIEPFLGLNASCPAFEPASESHAFKLSLFFAPLVAAKESDSASKTPVVPGAGAQP